MRYIHVVCLIKINHPSLVLQSSAAYESKEEIEAYSDFMFNIANNLGVEQSLIHKEMERILNLEKELANVGESFIFSDALRVRVFDFC